MATGLSIANLSTDVLAIAVTGVSLYFVARQKPSQYPYLRSLLLLVHVFFEAILGLEVVRNVVGAPAVQAYSLLGPTFVLVDVVLLTVIAYSVRLKPGGKGVRGRLRSIFWRWPQGFLLGGFLAFIAFEDAYLAIFRPYAIVSLMTVDGVLIKAPAFNNAFLGLTAATLVVFLAYPTGLLVAEALRAKDPQTRRALLALPFCWVGIGAEVLVFNGYLVVRGFDLIPIGYAISSFLFGTTAIIFRRTSVLSSFFEPVKGSALAGQVVTLGAEKMLDAAAPVLLEIDPGVDYESALVGLSAYKTSMSGLVYVFTSRGSPVHARLAGVPGARFYLMTSQVTYPGASDKENELLVPQNDTAVILDLMDKTISSTKGTPLLMVFDSITDLVVYVGFESAYKFLKQANEILGKPDVSSVYLMTLGAQEETVVSLTKSLFRVHTQFDSSGLKMTRGAAGAA